MGAIIGDVPPLDVDALLSKGAGGVGGDKDSPGGEGGQPATPSRTLTEPEKLRKVSLGSIFLAGVK